MLRARVPGLIVCGVADASRDSDLGYDPRPNAYSHLALWPADWRLNPPGRPGRRDRGRDAPDDFATQLKQALNNTETVLAAAGAKITYVAKFNLLIADHDEGKFGRIRQEFDRIWGDDKPAWTLIPVPSLALKGMLVEMTSLPSCRNDGRWGTALIRTS